jgi:hypothetical protein
VGGYAPRSLEDSMRPRRLWGASGRPLNFTVRAHLSAERLVWGNDNLFAKRMSASSPLVGLLILGVILLAYFGPLGTILAGLFWSQSEDRRDILAHGLSARGTVVGIRSDSVRGGRLWTVTVEFTVPDRSEPVRFEAQVMQPFWSGTPRWITDHPQGQAVGVHYREKWPSLAEVNDISC